MLAFSKISPAGKIKSKPHTESHHENDGGNLLKRRNHPFAVKKKTSFTSVNICAEPNLELVPHWLTRTVPELWIFKQGLPSSPLFLDSTAMEQAHSGGPWVHHAAGHSCCVATSSGGWGQSTTKLSPPSPPDAAASTYGRKGEEGDADQRECRRQQPPVPGLRVLVPVADGGESNLQGGDHRTALGQTASKLNQHGQNSHSTTAGCGGARVARADISRRSSSTREDLGCSRWAPPWEASVTPCHPRQPCHHSLLNTLGFHTSQEHFLAFSRHRAAIWCRGLRQLGASPGRWGCAFSRGSEPAQFPQTPFRHLTKASSAICMRGDLMLFTPDLPSSAYQPH